MAKICKKCGIEEIPNRLWIDGKRRNLHGRSFCLRCSPFGEHNTKNLCKKKSDRTCKLCGRSIPLNAKCGYQCHSCWQKKKEKRRADKVYGIVGEQCWICGYGTNVTTRQMMEFHHVDSNEKCFNLDIRAMSNLSWERVEAEMKKCVLLCCRCHREQQCGIVDNKTILALHNSRWT